MSVIVVRVKPRGGGGFDQLLNGAPKRPLASLLCEINDASFTTKCLITPAVCTVPGPSPRPSAFHDFSTSTTSHDEPGEINLFGTVPPLQSSV